MFLAKGIILQLTLLRFSNGNLLKEGPVILEPDFSNLTSWATFSTSSTCGQTPEEFCIFTGTGDNLGHSCSVCDAKVKGLSHPIGHAVDATPSWWKSRNFEHNVDVSVDFRQEFYIAYVTLLMGPSPRPATWVLEKSTDYGKSFRPMQFFAKNADGCKHWFKSLPDGVPSSETDIICSTKYSQMQPQEYGEVYVTLLKNRPGATSFHSNVALQNWTRATNLRLRFLRLHTLYGELMPGSLDDSTMTRHYFYSLREIQIGGRCICNGHAEQCTGTNGLLECNCSHNTCGKSCSSCCPGYHQMPWKPATIDSINACEACNCFGHATDCVYNETVANMKLSLDANGYYRGGGVCTNCLRYTRGINCAECKPGFYRSSPLNLREGCSDCDCNPKGSISPVCVTRGGQCKCLPEVKGRTCDSCQEGHWGFPYCKPCDCHEVGSFDWRCDADSGQCRCRSKVGGRRCDFCPSQSRSIFSREGCIECDHCSPLLEGEMRNMLKEPLKQLAGMKEFTMSDALDIALSNVYSKFNMLHDEMSKGRILLGHNDIRKFPKLQTYKVAFLRIQLNQIFYDELVGFHVKDAALKALKVNAASFNEILRFEMAAKEINEIYSTIVSYTKLLMILGDYAENPSLDLKALRSDAEMYLGKCRNGTSKMQTVSEIAIAERELAGKMLQISKRLHMTRPNVLHHKSKVLSIEFVLADVKDWVDKVKGFSSNTTKLNFANTLVITNIKTKVDKILNAQVAGLISKRYARDARTILNHAARKQFSDMPLTVGKMSWKVESFKKRLPEFLASNESVNSHANNLLSVSLKTNKVWENEKEDFRIFGELLENLSNVYTNVMAAKIIASSSLQLLIKAKQVEKSEVVNLARYLYTLSNWPSGNETFNVTTSKNSMGSSTFSPKVNEEDFGSSGCDLDDEDGCIPIHDETIKIEPIIVPKNEDIYGIIRDEGVNSDLWFEEKVPENTVQKDSPEFHFADENLPTVAKGFAAASLHFRKKCELLLKFLGTKWQKFDRTVERVEKIENIYANALRETKTFSANTLSDRPFSTIIANSDLQCEQAVKTSSRLVRQAESIAEKYRKAASHEVLRQTRSDLAYQLAENSTRTTEVAMRNLELNIKSLEKHHVRSLFRTVNSKKTVLRQRMDEALHIASQFKGAVNFTSPGFISLPIQSQAKSGASVLLHVSVSVRSNVHSAFIFQVGDSSQEQTLRLSLEDGHFVLKARFAGNETMVAHPWTSIMNEWAHVTLEKIGNRISLSVSFDCTPPKVVETSIAADLPLQMSLQNEQIYISGLPEGMHNYDNVEYFSGCMDDFFINGQEVSLFSATTSSGTREACKLPKESPYCAAEMKLKPMTFQGQREYMHFSALGSENNSSQQFTLELSFRTVYSHVFLAHLYWMRLVLVGGYVVVEFPEGDSVKNFSSHSSHYNNGKWHKVQLSRDGTFYKLLVDANDRKSEVTIITWNLPRLQYEIYLGQLANLKNANKSRWSKVVPFVGCIAGLNVGPSVGIRLKDHHVAVNGACLQTLWNCVCFEDLSRPIVVSDNLTLELQPIGLLFKTLNYKGTIFTYSTTVHSNVTVRLDGDGVQVTVTNGKSSKFDLLSLPEPVNDGGWHALSMMPHRHSLTLTLDNVTLSVKLGLHRPVYKKQHQLVVGMRALDHSRPSLIEFRGCLKEFSVGHELLDLGDHVISSRLGDCSNY